MHKNPNCACKVCTETRKKRSNINWSKQDTQDAIEFHWNTFSLQSKEFILKNQRDMTLRKLTSFWSAPQQKDSTGFGVASSLCGTSWFIALNYLAVDKVAEAKALILNGAFLHQCCITSIDGIVKMCKETPTFNDEIVRKHFPYFRDGFYANMSRASMDKYLNKKLTVENQRVMAFASQKAKGAVTDYIDQISSDWQSLAFSQKYKRRNSVKNGEEDQIEIIFADENGEHKFCIGSSMTMKSLFNEYADEVGISLRSIRLTYDGKNLFLSSVGSKTPSELGMKDLDVIHVKSSSLMLEDEVTEVPSAASVKKDAKKNRPVRKGKVKGKRKDKSILTNYNSKDECKIKHSKALTLLFEEADPKFKEIRMKLIARGLERCQRKIKVQAPLPCIDAPVSNPPTEGLGGKAGTSAYVIQVGEVQNLHKVIKPSRRRSLGYEVPQAVTVDLHGCTRGEALLRLDVGLPE